jgi:hypothetical protein
MKRDEFASSRTVSLHARLSIASRHLPGDEIDSNIIVSVNKDIHNLLEHVRIVQEASNVVKARNALERKVWQVLGDFFRFFTVLDVFVAHRRCHGYSKVAIR